MCASSGARAWRVGGGSCSCNRVAETTSSEHEMIHDWSKVGWTGFNEVEKKQGEGSI